MALVAFSFAEVSVVPDVDQETAETGQRRGYGDYGSAGRRSGSHHGGGRYGAGSYGGRHNIGGSYGGHGGRKGRSIEGEVDDLNAEEIRLGGHRGGLFGGHRGGLLGGHRGGYGGGFGGGRGGGLLGGGLLGGLLRG